MGAPQPEDVEHRQEEGEVPDALRRPLGPDLGAGDPPDLLGVGAEERLVEAAAEALGDPLLEGLRRMPARPRDGREVGEGAPRRLDDPEAGHHVAGDERVRQELALVVDARQARAGEELVAQHLLPQPRDRGQLGEEAVPAEVEAVAAPLDRARDPAHRAAGLEDRAARAAPGEHVGGGEPRRAAPEHGGSHARRAPSRHVHARFRHRPPLGTWATMPEGRRRRAPTRSSRAPERTANRPPGQRLIVTPAASRSQVSAVTPSSRSLTFCTRSVGVLGSASTKRM